MFYRPSSLFGYFVDSFYDLTPYLKPGDLIIDGGNSYFKDTDVRARNLSAQGIHFIGVGISGGEEGARHGPSIMPGGPKEAYERVRPIFEAAAAKADGIPCVTWLGPRSSGHFVKMVHNGIEYGIMQLIAETYDLMKRGLGMNDDEVQEIFSVWNRGELNGYLIDSAYANSVNVCVCVFRFVYGNESENANANVHGICVS